MSIKLVKMERSEVHKAIRQLFYVPTCFGLATPKIYNHERNHVVSYKLAVFVWVLLHISFVCAHLYQKLDTTNVTGALALFVPLDTSCVVVQNVLIIGSTIYATYYKEIEFLGLLRDIEGLHYFLNENQIPKWILKKVIVEAAFAYALVLVSWIIRLNMFYFKFPWSITNMYIIYDLNFFLLTTNYVVMRTFLLLIRRGLSGTNDKLDYHLNRPQTKFESHVYVKIYGKVFSTMTRFQNIYGIQILWHTFLVFLSFIYFSYMVMAQKEFEEIISFVSLVTVFLVHEAVYLVPLVILGRNNTEIQEEVGRFYEIVIHYLVRLAVSNKRKFEKVKEDLRLLKLHVDNRSKRITAFNFFEFDKKMILMLIGSLLSYIIIVVELSVE